MASNPAAHVFPAAAGRAVVLAAAKATVVKKYKWSRATTAVCATRDGSGGGGDGGGGVRVRIYTHRRRRRRTVETTTEYYATLRRRRRRRRLRRTTVKIASRQCAVRTRSFRTCFEEFSSSAAARPYVPPSRPVFSRRVFFFSQLFRHKNNVLTPFEFDNLSFLRMKKKIT